jgi:hypothetical protein
VGARLKPAEGAPARPIRTRRARIVLVVSCSNRKSIEPPNGLRLRSVSGHADQRAAEWRRRLRTTDAPSVPAYELYVGEHWRVVCAAYKSALKFSSRAELWVISAGHGLIGSASSVKSYSATFSDGSPDSVWRGPEDGPRRAGLQEWWVALPHEATLGELLRRDGAIVVAAGAAYATALDADLRTAAEADGSLERISLISAGSQMGSIRLPADGRLRDAVGGTDNGLNARVLAFLTAAAPEHGFRRSKMAAILERVAAASPATKRIVGTPSTDDQIIEQMKLIRRHDPAISRSRALTALRQSGVACEQSRFASLWTLAA